MKKLVTKLWRVLYSKVKAYLVGGTAAAGIAGGVLWIVHAATTNPPSWVDGFVPAASAVFVGLWVSYQTKEAAPGVMPGEPIPAIAGAPGVADLGDAGPAGAPWPPPGSEG